MMFRPIAAWNRFWFGPISARPLGAFRVVYGSLAIINLLFLIGVDTDYWFSGNGFAQGDESRALAGPLRFSPLQWMQDPASIRVVFGLTLATAVALTIGWRTRIISILFYFEMLSIHHRNIVTASGADVLFMVFSFYLMLSPCGAAYSLDAVRAKKHRGGTEADALIVPWAQRLIQIQICILYTVTSVLKVSGTTWLDGTALHYVLCNREVGRFDLSALAEYSVLVNLLTYGGLAVEFALAFGLWFKATRWWVIPAGLGLHFGILFLVNIPFFGELSTCAYLVFLSSQEWERLRVGFNPIGRMSDAFRVLRFRPSYRLVMPRALGRSASVDLTPTD